MFAVVIGRDNSRMDRTAPVLGRSNVNSQANFSSSIAGADPETKAPVLQTRFSDEKG
jgi:hypothetical protein